MKKLLLGLLALPLILALYGGCRSAKNTGVAIKEGAEAGANETEKGAKKVEGKVDDATITAAIKAKYAHDETVSASSIDVDTNHGNVTLNGTVSSQMEASKAVELARSVDGVQSVASNLVVQGTK